MGELLQFLSPKNIEKVAGAGNKFAHLVDGLSDFYLNIVPGIKFWDLCASEAIIKSRFGLVTDFNKRPHIYDRNL